MKLGCCASSPSEYNVATQMGNQGSAENGLRRAVEVVQAGFIGPVRQVYVWSNRPIWPQGMDRPAGQDPVPATLDWDLWLGPAPWRPFKLERAESPPRRNPEQGQEQGPEPAGRVSSVQLARVAGFRHRRAGRHGLPHGEHAVSRAQARLPGGSGSGMPPPSTRKPTRSSRRSASSSRPAKASRR